MDNPNHGNKENVRKLLMLLAFVLVVELAVVRFTAGYGVLMVGQPEALTEEISRLVFLLIAEMLLAVIVLLAHIMISNHYHFKQVSTVNSRYSTLLSQSEEQRGRLEISEQRFRTAIESTDNMVFEFDYRNGVYTEFANSEKAIGKSKDQINRDLAFVREQDEPEKTAATVRYFYHPDDYDAIMQAYVQGLEDGEARLEARVHTASGSYIWCRIVLTILKDTQGVPYRIFGYIGNIDLLKRQTELFRIKSEKDALTGFYNKEATTSLIDDALHNHVNTPHTLFVMDIDNFKAINDTMGHRVGDAVIAETGKRLRAIFRSDDILGRVGGDEFVVLISGIKEPAHIVRKADEVIAAFVGLSADADYKLNISVSIGIDSCFDEPSGYDQLFSNADKALYAAKRCGKNRYVFYTSDLNHYNGHTCNQIGDEPNR